jgi:streptogramin lyase
MSNTPEGSSAVEWAKYFKEVVLDGGIEIDEELMVTWFANVIMSSLDAQTFVQAANQAVGRAQFQRIMNESKPDNSGREFSLAITNLEQAQMWFTRGMALALGKFNPADLEERK